MNVVFWTLPVTQGRFKRGSWLSAHRLKGAARSSASVPRKIRNSTEVKQWLAKNPEFTMADFSDHVVEFFTRASGKREHLAQAFTEVRSRLRQSDREVLDMYLNELMLPKQIADRQGRDIWVVYRHIRDAKNRLKKMYKKVRAEELKTQRRKAEMPSAPIKVVEFQHPARNETVRARLVFDKGVPCWVDDEGGIYPEEVQDLLDNLDELAPGFEALDYEDASS